MTDDLTAAFRETFPALVRYVYRKVWDMDRAEEIAQEAFARAAEHRPAKLRSWLFVVASNLVRDRAREDARRRKHLTLLKHEPRPMPERPDAELERGERLARVRGALASLTPRDRELLLLWDAGHSYDEMAEQTGLARTAIGTSLARARKRLVEAFEHPQGAQHVTRG